MRVCEQGLTDGELVRRATGGDRACLAGLVERYGRLVHHVVRPYVADADAADDVAQDTWVRVVLRLSSLREPERFGCWVASVARRVALTSARQRDADARLKAGLHGQRMVPPGPAPDAAVEAAEESVRLRRALAQLPARQRQVVELCVVQGERLQQAALCLSVSGNTLKARLRRGRAALRLALAAAAQGRGRPGGPRSRS